MPNDADANDSSPSDELEAALAAGDPERVQTLIASGADIHYKREHGYDALVDAVHGRDVRNDPRLLDLLGVLIAHGVDLSGVTGYSESGLRVLSRLGRFDGARLLLDAGADRTHLEWSPLHEAVAMGTLTDVESALAAGADIEARDRWSRTAWLIAVLMGDLAKAKFLRDRGADPNARGRCEQPALFYALQGRHPNMFRWLLQGGADIHQTDEFGTTALIEAVRVDDLESVETLLAAGADVGVNANGTALRRAHSRDVILRLLAAGADPADLGSEGQRVVIGLSDDGDPLSAVCADDYQRAATRSFGATNPERMREPFWEAMIRSGRSAYAAHKRFDPEAGYPGKPGWCADRFGQSLTLLPDGRTVQVAGEHEDHYDADFCIYNDVFVHKPDGKIDIYGYPEEVFPPTDFHTATLIGDAIYLIGSLGYSGTRRYGETPVYRLDLRTFQIDRVEASGDAPGWLYKHRAEVIGPEAIRVWGGTVVTRGDGQESHDPNPDAYVLDVSRLRWRREAVVAAG